MCGTRQPALCGEAQQVPGRTPKIYARCSGGVAHETDNKIDHSRLRNDVRWVEDRQAHCQRYALSRWLVLVPTRRQW